MKISKVHRRRRRAAERKAAAVVELAICLPVLLLIGFGFINAGLLVQFKHNSKLIGHLAATELFSSTRDANSITAIETRYEQLATDLGLVGLDVEISETNDIAIVKTTLSINENSLIPINYLTADESVTETHVYAPFQDEITP